MFKVVDVSDVATLDGLALMYGDGSPVPFSPAFASDGYGYTASVDYPAGATVAFLDGNGAGLADADTNAAGHQVTLAVGSNAIAVKVTAGDGATTLTYTVTVTREAPVSPLAPADCRADAVWCTTMVAERSPELSNEFGYCPAGTTYCDYGGLGVDAFILEGAGYEVESVRLVIKDAGDTVDLSLDRDLPAARLAALTLRVGPHTLDLGDAARSAVQGNHAFAHNYRWTLPPESNNFVFYQLNTHPRQFTVQLSVVPNIPAGGQPGTRRKA